MLSLTSHDIVDYIRCPLYYYLKKTEAPVLPFGEEFCHTPQSRFKDAMTKTLKQFYYEMMSGCYMTTSQMRRKFALTYQSNGVNIFKGGILAKNDSDSAMLLKAVRFINSLHKYHVETAPGMPVAIDLDYSVDLNDTRIDGSIDMIWRTVNSKIYITKIGYDLSYSEIAKDLEAVLQCIAYRKMSSSCEDGIALMKVFQNQIVKARIAADDIKKWSLYFNSIGKAIKYEIYYPRVSIGCIDCIFKERCPKIG